MPSNICDEHEIGGYGLVKFTVAQDLKEPVILTIDQVNARHADETMKGSYNYAAIKFTLSKLLQRGESQVQYFINGDYEQAASVSKPYIDGLPKGEYLVMYQAEFTEENPMRKLVISLYADDPISLQRVCSKSYPA